MTNPTTSTPIRNFTFARKQVGDNGQEYWNTCGPMTLAEATAWAKKDTREGFAIHPIENKAASIVANGRPVEARLVVVLDTPHWAKEFGFGYDCPSLPEGLDDLSWHNDVCPSFGIWDEAAGEATVRIWLNHPVEEMREMGGPRFLVCPEGNGSETLYEGDDFSAALAALHAFVNA